MSTENVDTQRQDRTVPSEGDARALVERLRSAPVEETITEVLSTMLSTAQVKLGRRDARLLIDVCAVLVDHAGSYISDDLRGQVESALGQLRMSQVSAEREAADAGEPEPNDLPRTPPPPTSGGPAQAGSINQPASPSGLWVPGR